MDELVDKIQVGFGDFHVLRMDVLMIDGLDGIFSRWTGICTNNDKHFVWK